MERVSDLHDLAKILFAAGYKADMTRGDPRADWLGFIDEFHVRRLYLRQRIDFQWLASRVELAPPITADEAKNLIIDSNGLEICGGSEAPGLFGRRPRLFAYLVLFVAIAILASIIASHWPSIR